MMASHIIRTFLFAGFATTTASSQVLAGTVYNFTKPLVLHKIMQDLGRDMQTIVDGISRGDWKLIEKAASRVADHPKPPMIETVRLLGFIGTQAGKFKGYDAKTHDTALVLGEAAAKKDGYAVISAFSDLQNTCMDCHKSFRKSFRRHFYK